MKLMIIVELNLLKMLGSNIKQLIKIHYFKNFQN